MIPRNTITEAGQLNVACINRMVDRLASRTADYAEQRASDLLALMVMFQRSNDEMGALLVELVIYEAYKHTEYYSASLCILLKGLDLQPGEGG